MAITATFDVATQTLQSRASGSITYADVLDHLKKARRELPGVRELFDASGATTNLTAEEVSELARTATELFEAGEVGPIAVVATDGVLFELARMYQSFIGSLAPFHVFTDLPPALAWLAARPPR